MNVLIRKEFKNFFINKKNWLIFGIIILAFYLFVESSARYDNQLTQALDDSVFYQLQSKQDALVNLEDEYRETPSNNDLGRIIQEVKSDIDLLYKMQYALLKGDWENYLENKIKLDSNLLLSIEEGRTITSLSTKDLKDEIEVNELLLEKGIPPINTLFSMEGLNFISVAMQRNTVLMILFVVAFFTCSFIACEFEKGTYKLLYTQPIGKIKITLSKIVSALLINYLWVFSILGVFFMVLSFIYGIGDFDYPTKLLVNNIELYIPIGYFNLLCIGVLFLLVTLVVIVVSLVSSLLRNSNLTLVVSVILFLVLTMLNKQNYFPDFSHLNPILYLDITNVLKGYSAFFTENPQLCINNIYLIILVMIVISFILCIWSSKNTNTGKY